MFEGKKLEISPVRDAYLEDSECPLCLLMTKADRGYVDSLLGGAVMVPETRVLINRTGFCPDHYGKLFSGGNKLGLVLMTATHIREQLPGLTRAGDALSASVKKKGGVKEAALKYADSLDDLVKKCLICERLEATLERYLFTIVYLRQKDDEFAERFRTSRGFCIPHLSRVLKTASGMLPEKELPVFVSETLTASYASLERLTGELDLFAEHFDHRRTDMAWGSEKDAPQRALQKLSGRGDLSRSTPAT